MENKHNLSTVKILYIIIFFLLFTLYLFKIQDKLNVFILLFFLSYITLQFSNKKLKNILFVLIIGLFLVHLFSFFKIILIPFIISITLVYLLNPIVNLLSKIKFINRTMAALITMILTVVLFIIVISLIIIPITREISQINDKIPQYYNYIINRTIPWIERKFKINLDLSFVKYLYSKLFSVGSNADFMNLLAKYALKTFSNIWGWLSWLINIFMVPIITFYFLKDIGKIQKNIIKLIPLTKRDFVIDISDEVNKILGGFLRGQLTVSFIMAILYSLGLTIIGIDFSILIGAVAGFANIIPYFGILIGLLPSSLIAAFKFHSIFRVIAVIAVFTGVQIIEGSFLTPKILGSSVGLYPVIILFAIIIAGRYFGFWGMIVAIPTTAVLIVVLKNLFKYYTKSDFFKE